MVFRFPNPGADLERIIKIYRLICQASLKESQEIFDLDFMVKVVASNFQASSRGAIGDVAIARSTQLDRTRDPLYNQMKMYSEIYRNLGLLRPVEQRLQFRVTNLGLSLAMDFSGDEIANGIVRECLIAMTFPNQNSQNIGIRNLRPFRWLLMLMNELDGKITRHEMILGLLDVQDDRQEGLLQEKANQIIKLRKLTRQSLMDAVGQIASESDVQVNTLENYTRFPIGVLTSNVTKWAESEMFTDVYDRKMVGLKLTSSGEELALSLTKKIDVRSADLVNQNNEKRMLFTRYAYYSILYRAGLRQSEFLRELQNAAIEADEITTMFGIDSSDQFVYSPYIEESDEVLLMAESE